MGIARIILELKSRPLRVACAALVAILIAAAMTVGVKHYTVGTASTRVLVDTPSSQIVAIDPNGAALLSTRANLLASLMVAGPIKTLIAQQAGLQPGQVYGIAQSAPSAITNPEPPAKGYVLQTSVLSDNDLSNPGGNELPIIDITTQGPDAASAAKLANAAVSGLQQYLASQATAEGVSASQRIRLTSFASAQGVESARGPSKVISLVLALAVFLVGCAMIVFIPRIKQRERRSGSDRTAIHEVDYGFAAAVAAAMQDSGQARAASTGGAAQEFEQARAASAGGAGSQLDNGFGWPDRPVRESDHGRSAATPSPVRAIGAVPDIEERPEAAPTGADKRLDLKPFSATLRAVRGSRESR